MKAPRLIAVWVLSTASFAMAAEVQVGDSRAEVRDALGAPRGQVTLDGRQVFYYERGEVELTADTVTRVSLRTPEEQLALDVREERNRGERVARMTQLATEGAALRDRKLADENFKNAPLAYQVSYWENFTQSYPGVSVREPLMIARMRFNEQLAEQRAQDEKAAYIAELEQRLAHSENGDYGSMYTSGAYYGYGGYGYGGGYARNGYPLDFRSLRYDFGTTTAAPYETPHGSPYETPHGSPYETPSGSPYSTPTTIDFNAYYKPAPTPHPDNRYDGRPSDRGRGQGADRGGRSGRSRY
jgi:hypothetical protein